jgi:hypothetical protein
MSMDIPEDKDPCKLPANATDEDKAKCHYNAGCILEEGKQAKLSDGSLWTERELYLKAIELWPHFALPFGNLATCLEPGEKISFSGHEWNEQALYIRAIELDAECAMYWLNLAGAINAADRVKLHDGSMWDQRMLLVKTLELDEKEVPREKHQEPEALYQLAKTYEVDGTEFLKFPDGRLKGEWRQEDLYIKVIELDSKYSCAYHDLGVLLESKDEKKVKLMNGTEMTAQELFLKTVELDPENSSGYHGLVRLLEAGATATLSDGSKKTREELLAKAQELDGEVAGGEEGGA